MAVAAAASVPAKPIDINSWFSADDYPAEAVKQGIEGSVFFEVDVDATGKPTACRIGASSGSQILDEATCKAVLARAKFEPALNASGKPVAGRYGRTTSWRLPTISEAGYRAAILDFSGDPKHPICTIKELGANLSIPTCADILGQASRQQVSDRVVKLVFLFSIGSHEKPLYQGEPDWGQRISYVAGEQYYLKGSYPVACVTVAAEGMAAGRDACAGFPGARTISDKDKARARTSRMEQSLFAVLRSAPRSGGTCDTGESGGESRGCD
jgi:TonB family protein